MFYQHEHFGTSEYFCKESGRNFSFPKHIHRSFELIAVISGSMTVVIDGKEHLLGKNEAVLIFPNQIHSLDSTECEHMLAIFSQDIVTSYYARHTDEVPIRNQLTVPEHWLSDFQTTGEGDSIFKKKGLLYSVCALLDGQTRYEKRSFARQELLHRIFDYVEKNYMEECSLCGLQQALGYSTSYLSRYFSNATGLSFLSFVNRYRISKACSLLRSTEKTILECSLDCGYSCLRSFNRNFRACVGMTPKEYRGCHGLS